MAAAPQQNTHACHSSRRSLGPKLHHCVGWSWEKEGLPQPQPRLKAVLRQQQVDAVSLFCCNWFYSC